MTASPTILTPGEARKVALNAQGLLGPRPRGGPAATLRTLGGVQLDTISVLARSHELVAYARHGSIGRAAVEEAYWGTSSTTFEYWSHAACILPLEDWPLYAITRRARTARGRRWHLLEDEATSCADVVARLRAEGPLTARQLGGAKKGGVWWDWSEIKIAAEWLLDTGSSSAGSGGASSASTTWPNGPSPPRWRSRSAATTSAPWRWSRRPAARSAWPPRATWPSTRACPTAVVQRVLDRHRSRAGDGRGLGQAARSSAPGATDVLNRKARSRSLLISPFDSLAWDRARTERLFGFQHRLEAYVPRHKRRYGYFAMPVLGGTTFVALVDPGRHGRTFVAKQVTLQTKDAARHVAAALIEAAAWVGSDDVVIERVEPADRTAELAALVADLR